jgi:two-component system, OmpR family, alkaline phosphatase synthesis response regulator PhoP
VCLLFLPLSMPGKPLILLVDDDVDFVAINTLLLEQQGYAVATAHNGEDCLQQAECQRPDLIILDMMLSHAEEGFAISRDLRNSELTRHIPILMISAVNARMPFKLQPDYTWLPVDGFLEKPVEPQQLLKEVTQILQQTQTAQV